MIPVTDAQLEVYRAANRSATPDFTIGIDADDSDLQAFDLQHRLGDVLAECSMEIQNNDGRYTDVGRGRAFGEGLFSSGAFGGIGDTVGDRAIRIGDRIQFTVSLGNIDDYGDEYGPGSDYGGRPVPIPWTGVVEPVENERKSIAIGTLSLDATDFAGGILSYRTITDHYRAQDAGAIIRDICERKAPEVDISQIGDLGITTDKSYSAKDCWEAVKELAALADAVPRHEGRRLRIDPVDALPFAFEIQPRDLFLPIKTKQTPDQLHNVVRVESGRTQFTEIERDTFSSWTRVTDTSRETFQARARKRRLARIDVYVRTDGTSDDAIRVRLQADEGGTPVNISDEDSDIIRPASKDDDELPDDGTEDWVSFHLEEHTLPDRDPWVIVEADGADGHEIGLQSDGAMMVRTAYGAPRNFEVRNGQSITRFRPRQKQIERDNLDTLSATRDAASMELRRRSWPRQTISFEARSHRAHALKPGDLIDIWRGQDGAYGRYVVVERALSIGDQSKTQLRTEITAMRRDGLLARQT